MHYFKEQNKVLSKDGFHIYWESANVYACLASDDNYWQFDFFKDDEYILSVSELATAECLTSMVIDNKQDIIDQINNVTGL